MLDKAVLKMRVAMAAMTLAAVLPKKPQIMLNRPARRSPIRKISDKRYQDRSKYSRADIRRLYAERGITGPRPSKD